MTNKFIQTMTSSNRDDWRTPRKLFEDLDQEFHFTLDAAASDENHLCDRYYTAETDGLAHDWQGETVFCNPPYGRGVTVEWVRKAAQEAEKGNCTIVMLLFARVSTGWFHDYIYRKHEVRFPRGRLKFDDNGNNAPFDSMIVVFRGGDS